MRVGQIGSGTSMWPSVWLRRSRATLRAQIPCSRNTTGLALQTGSRSGATVQRDHHGIRMATARTIRGTRVLEQILGFEELRYLVLVLSLCTSHQESPDVREIPALRDGIGRRAQLGPRL